MDATTLIGIIQLLICALAAVLWFMVRSLMAKNEANDKALALHREDSTKTMSAMRAEFDREVSSIRQNCDKELSTFKVYVAQNHVTHTDLAKALEGLEKSVDGLYTLLRRIEEKLDNKQDKVQS